MGVCAKEGERRRGGGVCACATEIDICVIEDCAWERGEREGERERERERESERERVTTRVQTSEKVRPQNLILVWCNVIGLGFRVVF